MEKNFNIVLTFVNTGAKITGCGNLTKAECERRISTFLADNPNFEEVNQVKFSIEKG